MIACISGTRVGARFLPLSTARRLFDDPGVWAGWDLDTETVFRLRVLENAALAAYTAGANTLVVLGPVFASTTPTPLQVQAVRAMFDRVATYLSVFLVPAAGDLQATTGTQLNSPLAQLHGLGLCVAGAPGTWVAPGANTLVHLLPYAPPAQWLRDLDAISLGEGWIVGNVAVGDEGNAIPAAELAAYTLGDQAEGVMLGGGDANTTLCGRIHFTGDLFTGGVVRMLEEGTASRVHTSHLHMCEVPREDPVGWLQTQAQEIRQSADRDSRYVFRFMALAAQVQQEKAALEHVVREMGCATIVTVPLFEEAPVQVADPIAQWATATKAPAEVARRVREILAQGGAR